VSLYFRRRSRHLTSLIINIIIIIKPYKLK
jgi:hypothetical protein